MPFERTDLAACVVAETGARRADAYLSSSSKRKHSRASATRSSDVRITVARDESSLGSSSRQLTDKSVILLVENHAVDQLPVQPRSPRSPDTGPPNSAIIFAAGPLMARPATIGETAMIGTEVRSSRSRGLPANGQHGAECSHRIRRTDDDSLSLPGLKARLGPRGLMA
jgi:hypothetical protein